MFFLNIDSAIPQADRKSLSFRLIIILSGFDNLFLIELELLNRFHWGQAVGVVKSGFDFCRILSLSFSIIALLISLVRSWFEIDPNTAIIIFICL